MLSLVCCSWLTYLDWPCTYPCPTSLGWPCTYPCPTCLGWPCIRPLSNQSEHMACIYCTPVLPVLAGPVYTPVLPVWAGPVYTPIPPVEADPVHCVQCTAYIPLSYLSCSWPCIYPYPTCRSRPCTLCTVNSVYTHVLPVLAGPVYTYVLPV